MILANVRQCLTRNDAQLALRLMTRGSTADYAEGEGVLRERGIDAVLDDPRLMAALLEQPQGAFASLPLFTYVLVRNALRDAGEQDRVVADFVASILLHFGMRQRAQKIREHDDQIYGTLAALLADVESADPTRAFLVRAHLGNYALWLAGVFPDFIEAQRHRRGGPDLGYYDEMGQRGYRLAANHRLAQQHGMDQFFESVADRFGVLRVALNRVSDRIFFAHVHSADKLMRQVRDHV